MPTPKNEFKFYTRYAECDTWTERFDGVLELYYYIEQGYFIEIPSQQIEGID